jgi:hypothetical protein
MINATPPAAKPGKNTLLWKITPPGGAPSSYLFGTMHVRDLRAFSWFDTACYYLASCEIFANEFDFSEADEPALAAALQLPEGLALDKLLPRSALKNLDRYWRKKMGAPSETIYGQHPMAVSTALTAAMMSDEAAHSLDETLWRRALQLGIEITGMETFADQLATLGKIPFDKHMKNLTWLLKNYGRQKRRLRSMMHWYASGDIRSLYQAAKKDAKGMRRILLYERNVLMANRFTEIAQHRPLFCAVGAGHLAGGKGMLRLLKKSGFTVRGIGKLVPG